jgi:glycosyltransferase involved in cell wall biosynthesis
MQENTLKIWIVNPYGTLPSEGWREYRSAMLARALQKRGHQVVWWIADFEHRSKKFRQPVTSDPQFPEGIEIRCVPTNSYKRHIGLGRIRFENRFGNGFAEAAMHDERPDAIILAEPSLFFGVPVRKFAAKFDIPIILDVIDLWPELFHIILPGPMKALGTLVFAPLYDRRSKLARQAKGIAAVAGNYRDIVAAEQADKPTGVFYWGVDIGLFQSARNEGKRPPLFDSWPAAYDGLTVVYAGTLGAAYDIGTACAAARRICEKAAVPVRFIFAGDGPLKPEVEQLAADFPAQVAFVGSMPAEELIPYYLQSDVGLCSYAEGSTVSMPIKVFDYLAAGLAVASSLDGEIRTLVAAGCGVQYEAESAVGLAHTLETLAADKQLTNAMKTKAHQLALQFDIPHQYGLFAEFIEDVIANAA